MSCILVPTHFAYCSRVIQFHWIFQIPTKCTVDSRYILVLRCAAKCSAKPKPNLPAILGSEMYVSNLYPFAIAAGHTFHHGSLGLGHAKVWIQVLHWVFEYLEKWIFSFSESFKYAKDLTLIVSTGIYALCCIHFLLLLDFLLRIYPLHKWDSVGCHGNRVHWLLEHQTTSVHST